VLAADANVEVAEHEETINTNAQRSGADRLWQALMVHELCLAHFKTLMFQGAPASLTGRAWVNVIESINAMNQEAQDAKLAGWYRE
jgi:hypothetical protein